MRFPGAMCVRRSSGRFLGVAVLITSICWILGVLPAGAQTGQPQVDLERLLRDLPPGERWREHLTTELLPFWEMPEALGQPVGNFPTYRCNDGSLYDPGKPCPELKNPVPGIVWLDRDFVRSKSRQIYAYGVAYHITGDPKYLKLAKAGVDYLREHAIDHKNGGAVSYFLVDQPGKPGAPSPPERRSQDLAYAVTGMGFYYYLTHDKDVLADVLALGDFIFKTYYDLGLDLITWVKAPSPDGDQPDQKELVAQLDQVYGYLLLLAPVVPEPHRSQWKERLRHLSRIMIEQFFSERENIFWGAVTSPDGKHLGTDHTDFGHTVKTLWLIYEVGKLTDDIALVTFARERAGRILELAYLDDTGSWGRRIDASGRLDPDKEWWILAELDQVAGTLALVDPYYARYLPRTYSYWFTYMVDHQHKEIWHWVKASDNKPLLSFPKQHSWKNAFHSFEHALVSYLVCQELHAEPVTLFYAFAGVPESDLRPYFYSAQRVKLTEKGPAGVGNLRRYEATFVGIH